MLIMTFRRKMEFVDKCSYISLNYYKMNIFFKKTSIFLFYIFIFHFFIGGVDVKKEYSLVPIKSGISHITVNDIMQDKNGFLWFATEDGLNYFDGKRFKIYKNKINKNSIANNFILSIFEDSEGFIWIGTYNGGICKIDKKRENFTIYKSNSKKNSISNNSVYAINENQYGQILIGTYMGFNVFDKKTNKFTHYLKDPKNKSSIIRKIHIDKKKRIWIGTNDGLFLITEKKKPINYSIKDNIDLFSKCNHIIGIYSDKNDNLIFSTHYSLNFESEKNHSFISKPYYSIINNGDSNDPIDTIYYDTKDQIWIATRFGNSYIYKHKNQSCSPIKILDDNRSTPLSVTINKFYEERSGLMFIGTNLQGIIALSDKAPKFRTIRYKNKKNNRNVNDIVSISGDSQNNIWLKTKLNGVIKYMANSQKRHYDFAPDIKKDDPYTISLKRIIDEFKNDDYLVNGEKKQFPLIINVTLLDRYNTLWVGTESNGLFCYNKEKNIIKNYIHSISDLHSISSNSITSLHDSKSGYLWVGTVKGLNRLKINEKKFLRFYENSGLLNNYICSILEDQKKNLWLSTKQGLNKFNTSTGIIDRYNKNNGLQSTSFNNNSKYISEQGEMFFGTKNGVIHFYPEEIKKNEYIPPLLFTTLRLLDKKKTVNIANLKSIELNYKNSFRIDFISLNYLFSENNNYAYILEGRDNTWQYLKNNNFISFGKLDPGKYKLKVRGSNNDLVWNEKGSEIQLVIKTPFWSSIWIRLIAIILFLSSILLYLIKRSKRLHGQLKTKEEIENYLNKYNISSREKEIISLIVQGKSNKEIEEELFISLGTVKSHIHNIFQKLNIKSRAKLIKMILNQS